MLLLKLTVCSLLIIAFAEEEPQQSETSEDDQKNGICSTDCVDSVTAEGDEMKVKCELKYSGNVPTLTWHDEQDGPALQDIGTQTEESGTAVLEFSKKADASGVAPLFCKATLLENTVKICETEECDISSPPTIAISVGVVGGVVVTAIIGGLAYKFGYKKEG